MFDSTSPAGNLPAVSILDCFFFISPTISFFILFSAINTEYAPSGYLSSSIVSCIHANTSTLLNNSFQIDQYKRELIQVIQMMIRLAEGLTLSFLGCQFLSCSAASFFHHLDHNIHTFLDSTF